MITTLAIIGLGQGIAEAFGSSVQDKKCSELPQTLAGHAFEVDSLKPFYSRRFQGFVLYLAHTVKS